MKRTYCVFNRNRQAFLGLRVAAADTLLMRLRGALGRSALKPDDGIWLAPSFAIHTIGMLFPVDLVYLDAAGRVIHLVEYLAPLRISPIRLRCASILVLESRAIYSSGTRIGDELIVCAPKDIDKHCDRPTARPVLAAGLG